MSLKAGDTILKKSSNAGNRTIGCGWRQDLFQRAPPRTGGSKKPLLLLGRSGTGYSITDLARRLGMTQPAVGYAVSRGEQMTREKKVSFVS